MARCNCREMRFTDEGTKKTTFIPDGHAGHECWYIQERNALIPKALKFAVTQAKNEGKSEFDPAVFCAKMDELWVAKLKRLNSRDKTL